MFSLRIFFFPLITLLVFSTAVLANTVEIYETEEGTVTLHRCTTPIRHELEMPDGEVEWNFRPYQDGERLTVSGSFPSKIEQVPYEQVYLIIEETEYYQVPLYISPDISLVEPIDEHRGAFAFFVSPGSLKHLKLEFHYKVRGQCADNIYIYTARPSGT